MKKNVHFWAILGKISRKIRKTSIKILSSIKARGRQNFGTLYLDVQRLVLGNVHFILLVFLRRFNSNFIAFLNTYLKPPLLYVPPPPTDKLGIPIKKVKQLIKSKFYCDLRNSFPYYFRWFLCGNRYLSVIPPLSSRFKYRTYIKEIYK